MRRLLFILFLLPMLGFSQALQRQFFTTNTAPNVVVTAGTNAFITFSLIGQQRTYRIDTPASGTATNIVWPVAGTNVYLTTNGLAIVIDVPSPLIPWQAITNITSIQIPAAAITNAPWSTTGQTNLALTIAGTNVFVHSVTNLGVTTYTIDVPLQPQQTNWPWQSITNIATVQIPYSAITNPPAAGGQTNLALVVSGTNVFVSSVTNLGVTTFTIDVPASGSGQTNLALVIGGTNAFVHSTTNSGVTTFTVDGPAVRTNWAITDITNSLNLTNWALLGTNLFLPVAGGTSTGPQVSTSATTNAPANDEFVTGGWVRNLFNVGVSYFSSTNIQVGATNADSPNQLVYQFQSTIPQVAARSYATSDFLTNNGYLGSVITTNTFLQLGGQVVINAYLAYTGGASAPTVTLHPELYYSYDRTNWLGDWVAQGHTLTTGTTNLHQWVIDFQPTTSTNSTGFYVQRRYRCDGVSGAGVRTLWFLIGTNTASGTNDASHITVPVPSTSSLVYASNVVSGGTIPSSAVPQVLSNGVWIPEDNAALSARIGTQSILSTDSGFLLTRYMVTTAVNGHGFADDTVFRRNGKAYAAFDADSSVAGTGNDFDHHVAFQARQIFNAGAANNTLNNNYSFLSAPTSNTGIVTNTYHFKSHAVAGNSVNRNVYGLYLTTETNIPTSVNYGVYVENGSNYFGGDIVTSGKYIGDGSGISNVTASLPPVFHAMLTSSANGIPFITGSTRFYSVVFGSLSSGTEAGVATPVPMAMTLTNIYLRIYGVGANTNVTATVYTNGVASNFALSALGNGSAVSASSSSLSVTLAAGTLISVGVTGNNAAANSAGTVMLSWQYY